MLRLAAIGESFSEHPISLAIIDAKLRGLDISEHPYDVDMVVGKALNLVIMILDFISEITK